MQITVNALPMVGLLTGISRYLCNLYSALQQEPDVEINFLLRGHAFRFLPPAVDSRHWQKNTSLVRRLPDAAILALRVGRWQIYERRLRRHLQRIQPALHHETAFTPAAIHRLVPQVFTLHDLSLRHWRQAHPRERVWFADIYLERRLREAEFIITPSDFIRCELQQTFSLPGAIVKTIPEAADPIFRRISQDLVGPVLQRLRLPQNYLLFVGSQEPRKNIDTLIEALTLTDSDIPLVLCGWSGWGAKVWQENLQARGLAQRVFCTGHIPDDDLVALYNGASMMIYPSLYEGFGLPVLEAMACGCPVITSSCASLPEVAGPAAILLQQATDAEELAAQINRLLDDSDLAACCRQRGLARAALFSWTRVARETLAFFHEAANLEKV